MKLLKKAWRQGSENEANNFKNKKVIVCGGYCIVFQDAHQDNVQPALIPFSYTDDPAVQYYNHF